MESKYVLALDVGTTTARCFLLDQTTAVIGRASHEIKHQYPQIGHDEIEPEELWTKVVSVLREAVTVAGIKPHQIACIGISTQRSTFITWHRETGKPFHNFITWKDVRADGLVRQWNDSLKMKGLRMGAFCCHAISRSNRFLAGSVLKLMNSQVADQAGSLFGSCCFEKGDVKITMGTGTFLNVNTGCKPQASLAGLYPQIGWRLGDEIVFVMEGASHDTGSLIKWAEQIGLLSDPSDSSDMANSVQDSNGLCFIPAFSGIQAPVNNFQAAAGFIGIKPTTNRQHMVRAILESIVFRMLQLYEALQREVKNKYTSIRVDGGVSQNDFVVQLLADLTGLKVERPESSEMTMLGAAFLAGLHGGVWQSKDELRVLRKVDRVFEPRGHVYEEYDSIFTLWSQALDRFLNWYDI
ncbi:putative glycerol kinase 5 isoform X3 [Zootermopsis nevadensis]|uniref:putative glycerol kinase 5 isoform X3 n=1 Tax=Zootermopsis nevadensis TaxID=136037 RepID=UPI000B8EA39E|nr:putative glycerol kinase 5 isoform X3 [Zootermopsis nevadensis]